MITTGGDEDGGQYVDFIVSDFIVSSSVGWDGRGMGGHRGSQGAPLNN